MTGYPWSDGQTLFANDLDAAFASAQAATAAAQDAANTAKTIANTAQTAATAAQASAAIAAAKLLSVKDFGAVGDGVTNDAPAFQSAVNAVASQGGVVHIPPGNFALASTVFITTSNVRLMGSGAGGWHNIGAPFTPGATNLIWTGANDGTMISVAAQAVTGGQRLAGCEVSGLSLVAGTFPFTSAASIGLDIASCAFGKFDVTTMEFSSKHVNFRVVAGIGEDCNNEGNEVRIVFRALSNAGTVLTLGGTDAVGNTTMNHFSYIGGEYLNGTVIDFASCDNNRVSFVSGFRASGGTGNLFVFRGKRSVNGEFARQNVIYWVTEQTGGGKVIVEGTDTPGVTAGSIQNQIAFWDYGDDSPNIITGTGTSFWYGSNTYPQGRIFENFSFITASGASVSQSRVGDAWGLAVAGGAGTITVNATASGNSTVDGVQNVQITPLQSGATYFVSNATRTGFDLTVSGAGSFFWRAIVI